MNELPAELQEIIFSSDLGALKASQGISSETRALMRFKFLKIKEVCDRPVSKKEILEYLDTRPNNLIYLGIDRDPRIIVFYKHTDKSYQYHDMTLRRFWPSSSHWQLLEFFGSRFNSSIYFMSMNTFIEFLLDAGSYMLGCLDYYSILKNRSDCLSLDPNYARYKTINYIRRVRSLNVPIQYMYLLTNLYVLGKINISNELTELDLIGELSDVSEDDYLNKKVDLFSQMLEQAILNF